MKMKAIAAFILIIVFLSSIANTTFGTPTEKPASGLVGQWHFNEGSGAVAYDSSGYGNHGTIMNGAVWVDGVAEEALSFDGLDDYVSIPDIPQLNGQTEATFEYWAKYEGTPAEQEYDPYFICGYINGMDGSSIRLGRTRDTIYLNSGEHNGDGTLDSSIGYTFNENIWYHLALTLKVGDKWQVYANGNLIASGTNGLPTISIETGHEWGIGASSETWFSPGSPGLIWHVAGLIDEVCVYKRALSPAEIATQYLDGLVKSCNLPKGTEQSLLTKLDNALSSLEKGNEKAAANVLNAFMNAVEAQRNKKLTNEQATLLLEAAKAAIALIPQVVFSDNFEQKRSLWPLQTTGIGESPPSPNEPSPGGVAPGGVWAVVDDGTGNHVFQASSDDNYRGTAAFAGSSDWTDYTIEARTLSTDTYWGLIVRADPAGKTFYSCYINTNDPSGTRVVLEIWKHSNGIWGRSAIGGGEDNNMPETPGIWRDLKVEVSNTINGVEIKMFLKLSGPQYAYPTIPQGYALDSDSPYTSGKIGLMFYDMDPSQAKFAWFDDVAVTAPSIP
jgi:hypothetical protein